eukprot:1549005-Pleurochrysis_carterae.AAC.1
MHCLTKLLPILSRYAGERCPVKSVNASTRLACLTPMRSSLTCGTQMPNAPPMAVTRPAFQAYDQEVLAGADPHSPRPGGERSGPIVLAVTDAQRGGAKIWEVDSVAICNDISNSLTLYLGVYSVALSREGTQSCAHA